MSEVNITLFDGDKEIGTAVIVADIQNMPQFAILQGEGPMLFSNSTGGTFYCLEPPNP